MVVFAYGASYAVRRGPTTYPKREGGEQDVGGSNRNNSFHKSDRKNEVCKSGSEDIAQNPDWKIIAAGTPHD